MIDSIRALVETAELPSVPRDRVRGLVDIVIAALGQDFFERPRMERDPVSHHVQASHPLLRRGSGRTANELALAGFAEVGLYLETFARDPRIKDCVDGLRDEFESTLFQLAVAFRLHAAGCTAVLLEPDTARGRADIAFEYEGARYVAECYRINKTFFDYFVVAQRGFVNGIYDSLPQERRYSVTVVLGAPPTFDTFRRLLRQIAEIRDELDRRPDVVLLKRRLDRHIVGLEDITDVDPDPDLEIPQSGPPQQKRYQDADAMHLHELVPAKSVFDAVNSPFKSRQYGTRIFIWKRFSEIPKKKPHEILLSRLTTKLKQTKPLEPGALRLLFVEFPSGLFLPMRRADSFREVAERAARHFSDVAGIWVMERSFGEANRFCYQGTFLPVAPPAGIFQSLVDRLSAVEESNIFAVTNTSTS